MSETKDFARALGTSAPMQQLRERAIYADGEVPARLKTLAALLWSVSARCEPCIAHYAGEARSRGASAAELGEILAVATAMGGCVGETWARKAWDAFHGETAGDGAHCC